MKHTKQRSGGDEIDLVPHLQVNSFVGTGAHDGPVPPARKECDVHEGNGLFQSCAGDVCVGVAMRRDHGHLPLQAMNAHCSKLLDVCHSWRRSL